MLERSAIASSAMLRRAAAACLIGAFWAVLVLRGLGWGLPNPASFAPDDMVIPSPQFSGLDMMRAALLKYPPLQYKLFDLVAPAHPSTPLEGPAVVTAATARLLRCRQLTAAMALGSVVLTVLTARLWLPLGASVVAGILYLSAAMGVYYAHTTNADQPYVFWWLLSFYALCRLARTASSRWRWSLSLLLGSATAAALATKDQSYSLYLLLPVAFALTPPLESRDAPGGRWRRLLWPALVAGWACSAVYAAVWAWGGGIETFRQHLAWITGPGVERFRQVPFSCAGYMTLALKGGLDLYRGLGLPLLLLAVGGCLWWPRCVDASGSGGWGRFGRMVLLLPFVSTALFLVCLTRFSYPRFWLPVLPLACMLAAAASIRVVRRDRAAKLLLPLAAGLAVWHVAAGFEVVEKLEVDPRIEARRLLAQLGTEAQRSPRVAVLGAEWGTSWLRVPGRDTPVPIRTLRNWGPTRFGLLAEGQISLPADAFALRLALPDVVVYESLGKSEIQLLGDSGFATAATLSRPALALSACDLPPPLELVVAQRVAPPATDSGGPGVTPLIEQALVFHVLPAHLRRDERLLSRLGQMAQPFAGEGLEGTAIDSQDVTGLAIAYQMAGRRDDAVNAFNYLCVRWPSDTNSHNRRVAFERLGVPLPTP